MIIVGLGNPGLKYRGTRHNTGFRILDRIAQSAGIGFTRRRHQARIGEGLWAGHKVFLAKPRTFMNRSGDSVVPLLEYSGADPSELIVVHDDLDLPFGKIRIKQRGGAGGHKGIASIVEGLGTDEFVRVKFGIGRPAFDMEASDYVLSRFGPEEKERLDDLLDQAAEAVESILSLGVEKAMNTFNKQDQQPS